MIRIKYIIPSLIDWGNVLLNIQGALLFPVNQQNPIIGCCHAKDTILESGNLCPKDIDTTTNIDDTNNLVKNLLLRLHNVHPRFKFWFNFVCMYVCIYIYSAKIENSHNLPHIRFHYHEDKVWETSYCVIYRSCGIYTVRA